MKSISRRGLLKMGAALAAAPSLVRTLGAAQRSAANQDGGTLEPAARVRVNPTHHMLLRGATIITMDPAVGDFVRGDLHIQGKHIVEVGRDLKAPAGAEVIDAAGTILIPGFVDCHRHSWSAQFRRIIPDGVIANYMATTHQGFGPFYRPHDMYVGNLMTALGCIDAGITCIIDNSHNSRSAAHSDAAIEALFDSGIRGVHASGPPQFGTWENQWPGDLARLQKKYFSSDDQLVTLRAFANPNRENWAFARSLGLKIHADGISSELVEAFAKEKLLGPDFTFNHASGLTDAAWRLVRETGCNVDVCTRSDAQYGLGSGASAGVGGFQKALDFGVQPGFSVDNETSYSTDMFGEMRAAFFVQRALATNRRVNKDPDAPAPVTVRQVLQCATVNGAKCAALLDKCGTLTPGKEADIVMIRADEMNVYPLNSALGTVVQAAEVHNVDTVIIGGAIRKRHGALVGVNMPRFRQLVDESRSYLFGKMNYKLDILLTLVALCLAAGSAACGRQASSQAEPPAAFAVEEATIDGIHAAIRSGRTTCSAIVQAYIDRARAYNGVCTSLVTSDGADIASATGYVRAGAPLAFPTRTTKASTIFPDLDQYRGKPLDYGRMEPTISDPSVAAQMGMRVGIPNAGQLNALETLNIRGERSVTCKGAFDAHPSSGPLPAGAPAACEAFRQQPDASERAAELDARYGRNPDLAVMPMYCVVTAFKDPLDTKDMRTTANSDVAFAMDVPPFDATLVARLRAKGAIIYAKSVAHEFNAGPGNPGGPAESRTNLVPGGQAISAWSGQACNPYDTERVTRGSSSGSGVAISANLATIGICEQTIASCQGPASRNGIATLLATTGVMPDNGGIGNQWFVDRAGIHARTLGDAAKVLDAVRVSSTSYYDPREPFTAIPKALIPVQPYASFSLNDTTFAATPKPLSGLRIAILREYMVKPTQNHETISDQVDREIKTVLRDRLGAELVETITPAHPDDPDVPNLMYTFADALSELLPRMMPEIFTRRDQSGALLFAVPGHDVTSYDYLRKLSKRQAPLTDRINMTNIVSYGAEPCYPRAIEPWRCNDVMFDIDRYLADRGDAKIRSWADWVTNARFREDASRAGAENWLALKNHHTPGKADQVARSYIARLALQRVMSENGIDAFVHPENTVPTPKIQGPNVGQISLEGITPFLQIPRVVVPAGMTNVVYEPRYALNATKTDYISELAPNTPKTRLPHPMPIAITFFAGQGEEPTLIKIGTAYEAATHHRTPPPAFGPVSSRGGTTAQRR